MSKARMSTATLLAGALAMLTACAQPPADKPRQAAMPAKAVPRSPVAQPTVDPAWDDAARAWLANVVARMEAVKTYPTLARVQGDTGTAIVTFVVARDGSVLSHAVTRSSGSASLDRAVDALPQRAAPFPPMPDSLAKRAPITLRQPVRFELETAD